jgi:hypothetical protein
MYALAKLVTGEFVIGKVDDKDGLLLNVFTLLVSPGRNGTLDVSMLPYLAPFLSARDVAVPMARVVTLTEAPAAMLAQYHRECSGLIVPPSDLSVPRG